MCYIDIVKQHCSNRYHYNHYYHALHYACSPPGGTQCQPFTVHVLVIHTLLLLLPTLTLTGTPTGPAQVCQC
jgi:hypothetical protein